MCIIIFTYSLLWMVLVSRMFLWVVSLILGKDDHNFSRGVGKLTQIVHECHSSRFQSTQLLFPSFTKEKRCDRSESDIHHHFLKVKHIHIEFQHTSFQRKFLDSKPTFFFEGSSGELLGAARLVVCLWWLFGDAVHGSDERREAPKQNGVKHKKTRVKYITGSCIGRWVEHLFFHVLRGYHV